MTDNVLSLRIEDNVSAGAAAAEAALDKLGSAAEVTETRVARLSKSGVSLVNQHDAVTRSANNLERALSTLKNAHASLALDVEAGKISQAEADRALTALTGKVTAARAANAALTGTVVDQTTAVRGAKTAIQQLGVQSIDVFQQLASGAPIFTTMIQQGGQLTQVMASSGNAMGILRAGLGAVLSPMGLAVTGALAAGAAAVYLGISSESSARQLLTLQNTLRATRGDYDAMAGSAAAAARAVATTTGVSLTDARGAAGAFAAQPSFQGTQGQLESLIKTSADLAARLGLELPDAVAKIAPAMRDAGVFAKDMEGKLTGFDSELTRSIALQVQAGDAAGAFNRVMGKVAESTKGAADAVKTDLQKALDDLGNQFMATSDGGTSFGSALVGLVTKYVEYITWLVKLSKDAADAIKSLLPGGPSAPAPATALSGVTTSGAGAIGLMQLMPATARGLGVDPYDRNDNLYGGLSYIKQLSEMGISGRRMFQTPDAIAGAYNLGPGGYSADKAAGYNAKVGAVNLANMPQGLSQEIEFWGKTLGLSPNLIELGKRIAMVESGGQHYTGNGASASISLDPITVSAQPIAGTGVVNNPDDLVTRMLAKANASGVSGAGKDSALADIAGYTGALGALAAAGEVSGDKVGRLTEALQNARKAFADSLPPAAKLIQGIDDQTRAADALTKAQGLGGAAVIRTTAAAKAYDAALAITGRGMPGFTDLVAVLTDKYTALAVKIAEAAVVSQTTANGDSLALVEAENGALGMSNEARTVMLALLKAEQDLKRQGISVESDIGRAYLASTSALVSASAELDRHKAGINALVGAVTGAADSIGNAITNAFFNGTGAAVNWSNIARAAIAQVATAALKMAVINPLANAFLGTNAGTLGPVAGLLGGAGGSSGGGLLSGAGQLLNLGKITDLIGLTDIGGKLSGAAEYLGLSGAGSGLQGLLGTTLFQSGGSASSILAAGGGSYTPATIAAIEASAGGSLSVGGLLGGVGLGYGVGSFAGGFVQNSLGKVGPAPQIGAGLGAVAGTLIGGPVGGLIGGLLGGGAGGLIGPKAASSFSQTGIGISGTGRVEVGNSVQQGVGSSAETAMAGANAVNALLQAANIRISSLGSLSQIGANTPGGFQDPSKFSDFAGAIPGFRFTSDDPKQQAAIADRSFATLQELAGVLQKVADSTAIVNQLLNVTVPALTDMGVATGTLPPQINAITAQYDAAIQAARAAIASGVESTATVERLTQAETDLTAARDKATAAAFKTWSDHIMAIDESLVVRLANANATNTKDPTQINNAALFAFDVAATQERKALDKDITDTFGDGARAMQSYADQMVLLDKTLAAERLTIAANFNDRYTGIAMGAVAGLSNYIRNLETSPLSGLSPQDQYALALNRFQSNSANASAGDVSAIQGFQATADSLLNTSRVVNGSGALYARDFNNVVQAGDSVSRLDPGTLTASVFITETRSANAVLVDELRQLREEVARISQQRSVSALLPERVGA